MEFESPNEKHEENTNNGGSPGFTKPNRELCKSFESFESKTEHRKSMINSLKGKKT